ncbi:MAG: phycobiliprotein lyase [Merismopedia sp. SIO2A8]|nr:phycobiliprotein lyase [Merismopedia sp. SIO2A8]
MDIKEFFDQSCGKWFSQRTNQHLTYAQTEWGKSDVWIDIVPGDDPRVLETCDAHGRNAAEVLFGVTVKWEGFVGKEPNKLSGMTTLVLIPEGNDNQGIVLRQTTKPESVLAVASYNLDEDDVLTLATQYGDDHENIQTQERIWFVSPNLRLRSSLLKRPNQVDTTTFYSEIRAGGVKK